MNRIDPVRSFSGEKVRAIRISANLMHLGSIEEDS